MQSSQPHAVNVQQAIDDAKVTSLQWKVLICCFLIVATDGLDTAAIGFIAPAIMAEWGLSRPALTPLFMAGLFGLTVGALLFGPLADRLGRKKILIFSTFFFGLMSLLSAFSPDMTVLTLLRFLTGLGLGGAMPTAITLTSEFLPVRRRSALVTLMFCGFTLGSALGGILTAQLLPYIHWQGILVLGGVLPLALVLVLLVVLEESPRYRILRQHPAEKVAALMRKVTGVAYADQTRFFLEESKTGKSAISALFQKGLLLVTLVLWCAFFMSLLVIYMLSSWLPTLLEGIGIDLSHASWVTASFQIGGTLGALFLGFMMDKKSPYKVLIASYAIGGLLIAAIGVSSSSMLLLVLAIFGAGVGVSGAQVGFNALLATLYPTECRATGVSWSNAWGRCGAIFGALAGGTMISWGLDFKTIFLLLGIPALITAVCLMLLFVIAQRKKAQVVVTPIKFQMEGA